MQFTLTGFTQDAGCRVFAYEGIGEDRERIRFTVRADLALSRKHGIRLQELPLMCLAILQRNAEKDGIESNESPAGRTVIFTEAAMIQHYEECVSARDAAALKRAKVRHPVTVPSEVPTGFSLPAKVHAFPVRPFGRS